MQAAEKKRPKDEKDIVHRLRPFARLGSADDYEVFQADILYESMLRKKIQDLQFYRRMGLTTAADIDKYENDVIKRVCLVPPPLDDAFLTGGFRLKRKPTCLEIIIHQNDCPNYGLSADEVHLVLILGGPVHSSMIQNQGGVTTEKPAPNPPVLTPPSFENQLHL